MLPYRVKYTESEHDIQKNDLLYTLHQQCQNTFEKTHNFLTFSKKLKCRTLKNNADLRIYFL